MKRGIPPPTKPQQKRQQAIRDHGCMIVREMGRGYMPCEIHHQTEGGHTISQDHTVGLNVWSHRGQPINGLTEAQCEALLGPSLAHGSVPFFERFGSNEDMLRRQNEMIGMPGLPKREKRRKGATR